MKTAYKSLLVSFLILIFVSSINAQVVTGEWNTILNNLRVNKLLDPANNTGYNEVEGNPYLFDGTLQDGVVTMKDQEKYTGKFRYDIYANEVQFLHDGTYFAIADPSILDNIRIRDYILVHAMIDVKKGRGSYFELISDGTIRLLARKRVNLIQAEPPKAYSESKPAHFDRGDDTFYFQKDFRIAHKINKKNIREVLSDHREEIETYIKDKNVSFSSRPDLVKLITYYNSL